MGLINIISNVTCTHYCTGTTLSCGTSTRFWDIDYPNGALRSHSLEILLSVAMSE